MHYTEYDGTPYDIHYGFRGSSVTEVREDTIYVCRVENCNTTEHLELKSALAQAVVKHAMPGILEEQREDEARAEKLLP